MEAGLRRLVFQSRYTFARSFEFWTSEGQGMQSRFHDEDEFLFSLELLVHLRVVTYPRADIPMLLEG